MDKKSLLISVSIASMAATPAELIEAPPPMLELVTGFLSLYKGTES